MRSGCLRRIGWLTPCLVLLLCGTGFAQDDATPQTPDVVYEDTVGAHGLDTGDTAWMLVATALVLMMTAPGLALFYGGLVRRKNILGVMMQCFILMGVMSIVWALWGFSLAFAPSSSGGFVGGADHLFMNGVLPEFHEDSIVNEGSKDEPLYVQYKNAVRVPMSGSIPTSLFMTFQMMFFIITPALICGAFAERMRFSSMLLFSVLWGTLVYCPLAHWVWGPDGWLGPAGVYHAYDFAGGTVVHISSGVSALLACLLIGPRLGYREEPMVPHNLTYTAIGAALLWVGWFGFNAGSALASNASAVNAFVATHMCAAAGVVGWSIAEWVVHKKPSVLGACSGAVAGLVCITPAAGVVTPLAAIPMGIIAGLACYWACAVLKQKLGYDDSLDAFGVHGVGGTVGAVLAGVFATKAVDGASAGLFEGAGGQVVNQIIGVVMAVLIAVIGSFVLLKLIDKLLGLRVTQEEEMQGLDLSQHGEEGYLFLTTN